MNTISSHSTVGLLQIWHSQCVDRTSVISNKNVRRIMYIHVLAARVGVTIHLDVGVNVGGVCIVGVNVGVVCIVGVNVGVVYIVGVNEPAVMS